MTRKLSLMFVLIVVTLSFCFLSCSKKTDPITDYINLCKETNADTVLVVKDDKVLGEWSKEGYPGYSQAMSLTKSISSVVLGLVEYNGLINHEDKVGKYIPSWNEGLRSKVTIKHLLTHRGGILRRVKKEDDSVGFVAEKNEFVINIVPDFEPGTKCSYSNEGAQLLSPILNAAVGMNIGDYAFQNLFKPLGMNESSFRRSGVNSDAWTYADMRTTPRDLVKIGKLMINKGVMDGKRYLTEEYVEKSTTPFQGEKDFGYMWFVTNYGGTKVIIARGYLDTNLYVIPEANVIIVRMQSPVNKFSGEDEAYPYCKKEEQYISAIIDYQVPKNEMDDKETLVFTNLCDQVIEPVKVVEVVKEDLDIDENELLAKAHKLSLHGNECEIIEMLEPVFRKAGVEPKVLFEAHSLVALQYSRYKDFDKFKYHVLEARKYVNAPTLKFYKKQFEEFEAIVKKGHF